MTWLCEEHSEAKPLPVSLLAEGLFGTCTEHRVQPLDFGPAASEAEPVLHDAVDAEQLQATERARQMRVMVDAAREEAVAETRQQLELECSERVAAERARVDSVLAQFAEERTRWFRRAETEVVELALAVARRILHREVQENVLSLREIAKEAIARVQDGSGVVLRVAPEALADWRGAFRSRTDLEVVGDDAVQWGDCVLNTSFGRVELGSKVQLQEVAERFREMVGGPRRATAGSQER